MLVGGILEFVWGTVSHMALGITDDSFAQMPNEAEVAAALKATPPGTYMVPWLDHANADDAALYVVGRKGTCDGLGDDRPLAGECRQRDAGADQPPA
ncbi:MAG: hypothetical protein EXS13_07850 [Planctomycetes bacterium]|nr:hypothetical protein [Planctomycetota bacterium]